MIHYSSPLVAINCYSLVYWYTNSAGYSGQAPGPPCFAPAPAAAAASAIRRLPGTPWPKVTKMEQALPIGSLMYDNQTSI